MVHQFKKEPPPYIDREVYIYLILTTVDPDLQKKNKS